MSWALRFLGVGNAQAVELGSASAVIEHDGSPQLLIDCGQEALSAYLARYGVPRSLEDLQRQKHRTIHFSTMLGARPYGWEYPDGDS